jgi:hypothetical protein
MEFVYAVLGGVSCKLYDDLYDNQMIGPRIQEILKGTQWILLTLLSHNDFNFTIVNLIANAGNALNNWGEWKHPYESSLLWVVPVFLVISISTAQWLTFWDVLFSILLVLMLFIEPMFIKEEFSTRKMYIRMLGVFNMSVMTILGFYFGVSPSIIKSTLYGTGYFLVSSCFQAYMLWQKNESVSVEER